MISKESMQTTETRLWMTLGGIVIEMIFYNLVTLFKYINYEYHNYNSQRILFWEHYKNGLFPFPISWKANLQRKLDNRSSEFSIPNRIMNKHQTSGLSVEGFLRGSTWFIQNTPNPQRNQTSLGQTKWMDWAHCEFDLWGESRAISA